MNAHQQIASATDGDGDDGTAEFFFLGFVHYFTNILAFGVGDRTPLPC
jgi:hypothetical protein